MPKIKIQKKSIHDKFYTKPYVAQICYDKVSYYFSNNDFLIEPSAGSGSFSNIMRNPMVAYDLVPENSNIIMGNWFDQDVPHNSVIIGNPPFGTRNELTNKFIMHGITKAKCVAFILPMVYKKETMQKVFPQNWKLVEEWILPNDSFTINTVDYHVPCVFQIWINQDRYDISYNNIRESSKEKLKTSDFDFVKKDEANYFIFGAAPAKIIKPDLVSTNNRGYYIKCDDTVVNKIINIDWNKYSLSSVNGGVSWFTKQQIINAYCETY